MLVLGEPFTITEDHIKLLARSVYHFNDWDEYYKDYGYVQQAGKRPYGNSDVIGDIYEITRGESWNWSKFGEMPEELKKELLELHREMAIVVQILVLSAGRGFPFEAGRTYISVRAFPNLSWLPKDMVDEYLSRKSES